MGQSLRIAWRLASIKGVVMVTIARKSEDLKGLPLSRITSGCSYRAVNPYLLLHPGRADGIVL